MISFDSHIGQLEYLLNVNYIFVPAHIIETLGGLKCGRLICNLKNGINFQCGLVSLGNGDAYITLNKTRLSKLQLKAGDEIHVQLSKDESKYGMTMCIELSTLLEQDTEGKIRFDKLKPGLQRYVIFYVSQVKNSQLRINRAILLIDNLKKQELGKESFKAMLGK